MDQETTEQQLTVAEKEQIIALKVKEYEEAQSKLPLNKRKFFFSTTGPYLTRLIRDAWSSDMPVYAIQKLCIESLFSEGDNSHSRMQIDLAVKLVTGQMMLIGDSRIDSYPGGIEMVEDDGRFNEEFENYSIDTMIERIEKYFLDASIHHAELVRILNLLKNDIEDDDDAIQITEDAESEWLTPKEIREKIAHLNNEIEKRTDELDFLYPLVGKTIRNLPINKIATSINLTLENELSKSIGYKNITVKQRQKTEATYKKKIKKTEKEFAKYSEEREIERQKADLEAHRNLITPIKDDELKEVGSCWLLPDGTMYGGPGYAFIHDHIMYYLKEDGFFEESKRDFITEDVLETMNWCKLSAGHGFMLYGHNSPTPVCFTEAQKNRIIDWALAHEVEKVRINGTIVPLKHIMELEPAELMNYREWKYSDQNPETVDPKEDEVTEDELLDMFPSIKKKLGK